MVKCEICGFECHATELMDSHTIRCEVGVTEYQEKLLIKEVVAAGVKYHQLTKDDKQKLLIAKWDKQIKTE
jgi:hypothetical protein